MSIVEPSVLELLNHSESRYTLVVEASKRGRQLKIAVEEVNRGLIAYDTPADDTVSEE